MFLTVCISVAVSSSAIVTYQKESGCVVLSFRGDHIEQLCTDGQLPSGVKVGYIEGKRPLHPRSRYCNSLNLGSPPHVTFL